MEIVKPDGMVEDGAELIVQRLEIGLRIGLALLIPISEQLVLPCNHIFGGDLVDFPLAEVREQLRFDDILLTMLSAWAEQSEKLRCGKISKEQYDHWRYTFPEEDTTQRWAKVPSQGLSDLLVEAFKDQQKEK